MRTCLKIASVTPAPTLFGVHALACLNSLIPHSPFAIRRSPFATCHLPLCLSTINHQLSTILRLAALLAVVPAGWAQQFTPRIGYVYPAGGRQGAAFQVTVGGQVLDGVTNVYVSGGGIQASVVEFNKPMTQNEFNLLRDKLKELQDKRLAALKSRMKRGGPGGAQASTNRAAAAVWTAEDEKMIAQIRSKMLKNPPNRQANPAIAETVTLRVTLAADAEPGQRELRLGTPLGLSNPLKFHVGQLPEFSEAPARNVREFRQVRPLRPGMAARTVTVEPEMNVTLPAVLNGQIMPGGVDRFRFKARKGQHLVIAASARELIPYLPDAVPGWFQAALTLYDAAGHELQFADHDRFHPDPVLYYEVPKDADYVLAIRDSIYRGREDFVYRVTIGEVPFVRSVFPLGGQAGTQPIVETSGWNLPGATLTQDAREKAPGIFPVSVRKEDQFSNPVPFAVDKLPECREQETNNLAQTAQAVTMPIIVNGRIDQPGDWDVFRFEGRAGSEIVAEIQARRLDSPLDSVLKLTDAGGRQLAFNDDHDDKGAGLTTHHADSRLSALLPADGTYYVYLGDAQHQGGPEYGYRLRISPPQPDFDLRVVPSSLNLRAGASVPFTVYALRKDGFSNEIALALKDAPAGFTLSGATVPAGQDSVRLTLTAPAMPSKEPLTLSLVGRATIQGRVVVRPAVPAEDMMQAFAYRHLVPAKELKVAVLGRWMPRVSPRILGESPVKIPAGGTARVQIAAPSSAFADRFQLELSDPPPGLDIQKVSPSREGAEMVLHSDAAKAKPGLKGNLIVNVFAAQALASAGKAKPLANRRRAALGTLPAIAFEIVDQ